MHLSRGIKIQLAVFSVVSLIAGLVMIFVYVKLPVLLFGVGRYTVTVELPRSGGLYATGNVTYRGVEVGRVDDVKVTPNGSVAATLSLKSGIDIPSDVRAEVHSVSAVGEQYVALIPRSENSPPLKDGDVIPVADTWVPPDINSLFDSANAGLDAIPDDALTTMVDESYVAVGGLGPELARLVKGSTALAIDARQHLDALTALIDEAKPVLDSQSDTSSAIDAWAAQVADIAGQLKAEDHAVAGFIDDGGPTAAQAQQLLDRIDPTLPTILVNLSGIADVALTYNASVEQLLVLLPHSIAVESSLALPNANTRQNLRGLYLSFNLNINVPPPCTTGYIPVQQQRTPDQLDFPERQPGDLYCRIPQDAMFGVRGVRNTPCPTKPGKRAPTAKMCRSDQEYVPLNDGNNWKGDPNATLSGQAVPQPPSQPIAAVPYDPATGTYVGPDGKAYTQADLARDNPQQTWQSMLIPPAR
ncbi:MCE family protein [Mycolicibacterium pulveris]|uniref:Mammalian cell entry protein n=1 Tax=Mycolicibacterium pulveris TaxID=36813 RepID=A0A7I7UFE7_MYCPV|nr:MlaD family protein [Mycolicibacterium pulveris]MCV6978631.1 MCE family protein [Mycolicibacterium pulveris]BBY80178.1 mammalian cell entry protein [Mycolicibacterium pulveris]